MHERIGLGGRWAPGRENSGLGKIGIAQLHHTEKEPILKQGLLQSHCKHFKLVGPPLKKLSDSLPATHGMAPLGAAGTCGSRTERNSRSRRLDRSTGAANVSLLFVVQILNPSICFRNCLILPLGVRANLSLLGLLRLCLFFSPGGSSKSSNL